MNSISLDANLATAITMAPIHSVDVHGKVNSIIIVLSCVHPSPEVQARFELELDKHTAMELASKINEALK